jgi:hypothetical protein
MFKKLFFLFLFASNVISAQNDTLVLVNGDVMVGRIKGMNQTVLVLKTVYSNVDFNIDWLKIKKLSSDRSFILFLSSGERVHSQIKYSSEHQDQILVINDEGKEIKTKLSEIIFIDRFGQKFFKRVHIDLDAGVSLQRSQNYIQFNGSVLARYLTDKWKYSLNSNITFTKQDSTNNISRKEINLSAIRFIQNDWFVNFSANLLSNTAQDLKLRATENISGGYLVTKSNHNLIATSIGMAFNSESYNSTSNLNKNSIETFAQVQYYKYLVGTKLSIDSSVIASPSITEKKRFRLDLNLNLKYKFTSTLYIKPALTYNFDNQASGGTKKGDYTFQTSIGWNNN